MMLLDPDSFTELDEFARHRSTSFGMEKRRPYGDGVVTGFGTIDGRPVCVFSQDVTVFGGSLGQMYGEKIVKKPGDTKVQNSDLDPQRHFVISGGL